MKSTIPLVLIAVFVTMYPTEVRAQSQTKEANTYVGGSSCALCHIKQSESFKKNKHTSAFTDIKNDERYLKLKKEGKEGSCLKCHTTGYGENGGFTNEESTPELAKVNCEGCHGPGNEHIAVNADDKQNKKKTIQLKPDCGKCHLIHAHEG